MQIQFQCVFEDYVEAMLVAQPTLQRRRWLLVGGVVVGAWFAANLMATAEQPATGGQSTEGDPSLWLSLAPWLVMFLALWLALFRSLKARGGGTSVLCEPADARARELPTQPPRRRGWPLALSIIAVFLGLTFGLLLVSAIAGVAQKPAVAAWTMRAGVAIALVWPLVLAWAILMWLLGGGRVFRSAWRGLPRLHDARAVAVNAAGVSHSSALNQGQYSWQAFTHVMETPNLFLLMLGYGSFMIVPKRAFAGVAEMCEFRELIRGAIVERSARPAATSAAAPPQAVSA